jgi:hypothetical protein
MIFVLAEVLVLERGKKHVWCLLPRARERPCASGCHCGVAFISVRVAAQSLFLGSLEPWLLSNGTSGAELIRV